MRVSSRSVSSYGIRAAMLACALLACGSGSTMPAMAAAPSAAKLKAPTLKYEKYTLPNGLVVMLREDHRLPLVAVDLWYHVGPANEKAGRTGFAHLFEHMMFEGSEHVGEKAHFKYLEGAGATDINGTTNYDHTNYFETVPSNQLDLALWLESDRMGFLMETLDRAKLTNQRDVVRNELREDESRPYYVAHEAMGHLLYPKTHPYYANVIGSHADVESARLNDVRDFFHSYYTPNNASVAIVGDFNPATIKEKIARYFGPIPSGPAVDKVQMETPVITTERRVTITDTVQLPRVSFAWITAAAFQPGDAEADMFTDVLGGGKTSRLYKKLVYEGQLAQSIACFNQSIMGNSLMNCDIVARPNVKLEDIEAAFDKELDALRASGPTQAELDESRAKELSTMIQGLQRLGGFGGVADEFDRYYQYTGDPGYLAKDIARYEAVTTDAVKSAGEKYFGRNQRAVVYCQPGKKLTEDVPRSPEDTDAGVTVTPPYPAEFETAQNWRKDAPKPGPEPALHLPAAKSFALANGLKVYLMEEHGLPLLNAEVVTLAGSEKNPLDKPGLAAFAARMLTEGTEKRSSAELADQSAEIGVTLGSGATTDMATASVTTLTSHTAAAMDLLSDIVIHPAFRADEVERIRKQRLVGILQEGDQPMAAAMRVAQKVLYGDTPYGFRVTGTTASVKAMTRDELAAFWTAHAGAHDAALIFAGDVTEAEAKRLAEQYFGKWAGGADAGNAAAIAATAAPARKVVIVDKPNAPQTALVAMALGVPRNTPDYAAVTEMNGVLGGLFSSRLNMNLREKNGFTYGAGSGFSFFRDGGPFMARTQVRSDVTGPAARELFSELGRIQTDPASEAELKLAKDNALHSLPGEFETTAGEAGLMAELFAYGLPLDYFQKLPAAYAAVTPEAVAKAAKDYIHPDQFIVIAVGDKAKIEPEFEKLNLGPIEIRDASGDPVKP
jgi:zinc protease